MVRLFLCMLLLCFGPWAVAAGQTTGTSAECETDSNRERFYALDDELTAALRNHDDGEAERLAHEYLALADQYKDDWNYGNAVHDANEALGLVALREKNPKVAAEYLLKAGATPGSPQLNSFGPNLALANALLAMGERESVVSYLRAISSFWESGRGALQGVIARIEKGERPVLRREEMWTEPKDKPIPALAADDQCLIGYQLATKGLADAAVELLSGCVGAADVSPIDKRNAYVARAWAYRTLGDKKKAVADQEAAFALGAPTYAEVINYGLYLREAGRAADSLAPLLKAEAMESATGKPSMMTEYQLGWSFQVLGKNEEAIAAFTKGIPAQPDYLFVYYMRGLSLEAVGRKGEAKQDFEKVSQLIAAQGERGLVEAELEPVRRKLAQYGLK